MIFYIILSIVIVQRLLELVIAKRNEKNMRAQGAYEVGASHYPLMILLHVSFFISLLIEVSIFNLTPSPLFLIFLIMFLCVQGLRIWCLTSLGSFWNTKIIILPGATVVTKGPYKYLRHPNSLVVSIEIALLPLMFEAYFTAICFTILNAIMLSIRIPAEERALEEATNYEQYVQHKNIVS